MFKVGDYVSLPRDILKWMKEEDRELIERNDMGIFASQILALNWSMESEGLIEPVAIEKIVALVETLFVNEDEDDPEVSVLLSIPVSMLGYADNEDDTDEDEGDEDE